MTQHPADRDPAEIADALSASWDAFVGGTADVPDREGGLVEIVGRLHAADTTPALSPTQRTRIWEEIMATQVMDLDRPRIVADGPGGRNGRAPAWLVPRFARTTTYPSTVTGRGWWHGVTGQVATAALLVLVLAAGLFAAGPLRPNREATAPAGIPAVMMAPATPSPEEVVREVLVETTVPAEALPTAEDRYFHISQETIEPNVTVTVPAAYFACCPGPLIDHVLVGELTVRVEGPLRVARAGTAAAPGPVEEVAPGTEVVLRAGDTALYDQALPTEYTNRGTEPVQLVGGGVFIGRPLPPPPGRSLNNFDSLSPLPPLPAGPVTFILERVTLPPRATLPGPPPSALRVVTSGPKVAYLPKAADGSVTNLVREPIEAYALTLIPAGSESEAPEATPTA